MPSEGAPQQYQTLESLKRSFKQRLDKILNKELTVENIEVFADEALDETITLTDDVLKEYRNNLNVFPNVIPLDKQEQENEAFEKLDLPNIQEILQSVIEVKNEVESIKTYLNSNTEKTNVVNTPPQEGQAPIEGSGEGGFENKETFPRLLTLMYILKHDFDIEPTDIPKPQEGKVTRDMVRKTPYVRVDIPQLNRAVYICEEEGNVTYVFDTERISEAKLNLDEIDLDDKGDKNSLISYHPGIGVRVIQTKNWRSRITQALKEIPKTETKIKEEYEREERKSISEFKRNIEKLSWEDFQREVNELYPGTGSVDAWYRKEYKNHPNWPANPERIYKNKGWQDWPGLVGKENHLKKDFLNFENFLIEVQNLYSKGKNLQTWYNEERKNHPNWPANPARVYKDKGWVDWSYLGGRENYLKKNYLSFDDFKKEVNNLYTKGNIAQWYNEERKNHPNWPSKPQRVYKDKGWDGFPEIVEKESHLKRNFLPFDDFVKEINDLYPGGAIEQWYRLENKKHPNWPSNPKKKYKDQGWVDWPSLVGKENPRKMERLNFEDFKKEVLVLYPGQGDVQRWYFKEVKNHPSWPSNPHNYYEEWEGWSELVGKDNRFKKNQKKL